MEAMTATHIGMSDADLDGGSLGRLVFHWIGDRYQHCWLDGRSNTKILESIESDHAVHWPDSPPLQQVYHQSFDDGREVMFGIGMSGKGHWSASFTLVPDLRSWIVELACCSQIPPQRLASSYRLWGDWQSVDDSDSLGVAYMKTSENRYYLDRLNMHCVASARPELPVAGRQGYRLGSLPELTFQPECVQRDSTTTQWGFRLRIE